MNPALYTYCIDYKSFFLHNYCFSLSILNKDVSTEKTNAEIKIREDNVRYRIPTALMCMYMNMYILIVIMNPTLIYNSVVTSLLFLTPLIQFFNPLHKENKHRNSEQGRQCEKQNLLSLRLHSVQYN